MKIGKYICVFAFQGLFALGFLHLKNIDATAFSIYLFGIFAGAVTATFICFWEEFVGYTGKKDDIK